MHFVLHIVNSLCSRPPSARRPLVTLWEQTPGCKIRQAGASATAGLPGVGHPPSADRFVGSLKALYGDSLTSPRESLPILTSGLDVLRRSLGRWLTGNDPPPMRQSLRAVSALLSLCIGSGAALATAECPAVQALPQVMTDPGLCASLEDVVRKPAALPLDQYEAKLGTYLRAYCHRNPASGWVSDKTIRDTGPFTATLKDGKWAGT